MPMRLLALLLVFLVSCDAPEQPAVQGTTGLASMGSALPFNATVGPVTGRGDFGFTVDGVGDLNGDGYAEVLVTDQTYPLGSGSYYVYEGGPDGVEEPASWSWSWPSPLPTGASAGDVNGDGYGDVLIGDGGATGIQAAVFLGSATGAASTPVWSFQHTQLYSEYGAQVTAGDFNGDGFSDWVVGGRRVNGAVNWAGGCFVYYGGAATLPSASQVIQPSGSTASFCAVLANAGDVNGDGADDLVVGSQWPNSELGAAWLYLGSGSGLQAVPSWTVSGQVTRERLGTEVAGAGDLNGDGYADVLVTSPNNVHAYFGSAGGLGTTPSWSYYFAGVGLLHSLGPLGDANGDGYADLAFGQANNQTHFFFGGPTGLSASPDQVFVREVGWPPGLGFRTAGAGDVNGDGFSDAIAATTSDLPAYGGTAYMHMGSPNSPDPTPALILGGDAAGDQFGAAVASDGDVDGDGFDDLLIGAPLSDTAAGADAGGASLYLGGPGGPDATADWSVAGTVAAGALAEAVAHVGDLDGDGYSELALGCTGCSAEGQVLVYAGSATGPSAAPTWTLTGTQAGELFGADVAGAGDLNADGYADLVVGAEGWDGSAADVGRALVFLGSSSGPGATADWSASSTFAGAAFGHSVSGARDVDGDGYDDLLIGAPYDADTLVDEGKAYLFLGGPGGPAATAAWEGAGQQAGGLFGWDVGWAGDLDADGFDDFLVGAPLADQPGVDGGAMFGFAGTAGGAIGPATWTWGTSAVGAQRGTAVLGLGDDWGGTGYFSTVSGAPSFTGATDVGRHVRHRFYEGGTVVSSPVQGTESGAELGAALASGDLNGDGSMDLVAGAPGAGGAGEVTVHFGNTALVADRAWTVNARARSPGGVAAIPSGGRSTSQTDIELVLHAASPYGRTRGTIEYEIQPHGTPFDLGAVTFDPTAFLPLGCPAAFCVVPRVQELVATVSGLDPDTAYHWRARIRYDAAHARPNGQSRWYYGGRVADPDGPHFRTALEDADLDGWPALAGDCDDGDPAINPDAAEACDGIDDNCDGVLDDGFDADQDGVTTCGPDGVVSTVDDDCDDTLADVFPGATEVCDAVDQDCDFAIDEGFDADGDGVTVCGPDGLSATLDDDCDDGDAAIAPGQSELCDGIDQDCDGSIVDEYLDFDGDGVPDCQDLDDDDDGDPDDTDCADDDDAIYNGAPESCDDVDSNCNGSIVDGDPDQDNNGEPDCVDDDDDGDGSLDGDDCEPLNEAVFPGASELCDSVDSNCDADLVDSFSDLDGDGTPDCVDADIDGDGSPPPAHGGGDCDDLDPLVFPGQPEACDGLDTNCDGTIPNDEDDDDEDGVRVCGGDCDDADDTINPDRPELCNGIDDDCSGAIETADELSFDDWFLDTDGDGYGNPDGPHPANPLCAAPAGYVLDDTDCDDSDPGAHPDATEVVGNALDEDCDGVADGAPATDEPDPAPAPAPGIACDAAGSRPSGWALLALLGLLRQRRARRR